jgi:hypothetical protein
LPAIPVAVINSMQVPAFLPADVRLRRRQDLATASGATLFDELGHPRPADADRIGRQGAFAGDDRCAQLARCRDRRAMGAPETARAVELVDVARVVLCGNGDAVASDDREVDACAAVACRGKQPRT